MTARRFRGWVSRGAGEGRTTLQELTLRPISRPSGRRPHGSDQPLLLERRGGARAASEHRAAAGASTRASSRRAASECSGGRARRRRRVRQAQSDGVDPGPWRRRRRRGGRSGGPARAGGRSRLRLGHAAMRRLLSVPARPERHVPVPRTSGPGRPGGDGGHARRHAGVCELAHRRTGGADGHVRGMGGAVCDQSERPSSSAWSAAASPSPASAARRRAMPRSSIPGAPSPSSDAVRWG